MCVQTQNNLDENYVRVDYDRGGIRAQRANFLSLFNFPTWGAKNEEKGERRDDVGAGGRALQCRRNYALL